MREYLDGAPRLDQWQTPLLTLDRGRLDANRDLMAEWTTGAGVALAPHGKTTMAPRLWREQLVAGSWGITLATAWQAQLARSFGVGRIMLANTLIDPVGLAWAAAESARNPDFELYCWVDGVATVELMDKILRDTALGRACGCWSNWADRTAAPARAPVPKRARSPLQSARVSG